MSEDQVALAREGRSSEVLGAREPVDMTEDEVKAAGEGRSEEVLARKLSSD